MSRFSRLRIRATIYRNFVFVTQNTMTARWTHDWHLHCRAQINYALMTHNTYSKFFNYSYTFIVFCLQVYGAWTEKSIPYIILPKFKWRECCLQCIAYSIAYLPVRRVLLFWWPSYCMTSYSTVCYQYIYIGKRDGFFFIY